MKPRALLLAAAVAVGTASVAWRSSSRFSSETVVANPIKPPEAAPLCPWREPEADLKLFFPGANRHEVETRILSGMRLELGRRLRRLPTGDENALRLYPVYEDGARLGTILTRRVKGEYGAIEIVLAVDTNRCVRGLRLQRLREPESIAGALQGVQWQNSFVGKRVEDSWLLGSDVPGVPAEARASADAVVDGARSLMILLDTSERAPKSSPAEPHH